MVDDIITLRARRIAAEVAHLLETGTIPDTDAREPDHLDPYDVSGARMDGAAADEFYGREYAPYADERGRG